MPDLWYISIHLPFFVFCCLRSTYRSFPVSYGHHLLDHGKIEDTRTSSANMRNEKQARRASKAHPKQSSRQGRDKTKTSKEAFLNGSQGCDNGQIPKEPASPRPGEPGWQLLEMPITIVRVM
ncbi:unnamed protein product [Protopolystoma xenopodis]|uniref:Uncharacterized protein n=1 Tax=Protopolystoma xenopodis TaxID=117903 RepID=A0A3S5AA31_9PLAT|nr:unnamed protein product [Protopolystoma xenopodis]